MRLIYCAVLVTSSVAYCTPALAATTPCDFTVAQISLAPGATISVGGRPYTIVELEIPRYNTDVDWVIRFPRPGRFDGGGTGSVSVTARGRFADQAPPAQKACTVTLNSLTAFVIESFYYQQNFSSTTTQSSAYDYYGQSLELVIRLGGLTDVIIQITPGLSQLAGTGAPGPTSRDLASPYGDGLVPVTAAREQIRADLRELLRYVSVRLKQ